MENVIREYDARIDSKKRVTLRDVLFNYYHVKEYDDGNILLEPRELVEPFSISANSLSMMESSISNLKEDKVSEEIDISEFSK